MFSKLVKSQAEYYRQECNFTNDEEEIFKLLIRGKSRVEIAHRTMLSVPTVDRRIRDIKNKIHIVDSFLSGT